LKKQKHANEAKDHGNEQLSERELVKTISVSISNLKPIQRDSYDGMAQKESAGLVPAPVLIIVCF
jgi:hypothetical protein